MPTASLRIAFLTVLTSTSCGGLLVDAAGELDPGEVPPLLAGVPESLRSGLVASEDEIEQTLVALRDSEQLDARIVVRAALGSEALTPDGECELRCLRDRLALYGALVPLGTTGFEQYLESVRALRELYGDAAQDARELVAFIEELPSRAERRMRWAASRLLRSSDEARGEAEVYATMAHVARATGRHERARELYAQAVRARPTPRLHAHLAVECYATGDLRCGDDALASLTARDGSPEAQEALARVRRARDAARTLRELEGRAGVEAELRRGTALETLGRWRDARALYQRLTRDAPRDARPWVRLAALVVSRHIVALTSPLPTPSLEEVRGYLARAAERDHRDAMFYGLTFAVWHIDAVHALARMVHNGPEETRAQRRALAAELASIEAGLASLDPEMAGVTGAYGRFLLEGDMAALVADTAAVRSRTPRGEHAYRLALFASAGAARDRLDELWTPALASAAAELRRARLEQALRFDDPSVLPNRESSLELTALADVLRARHGETGAWERAAAAYRRLAEEQGCGEEPVAPCDRYANNLGVALHRMGRSDEASHAWSASARPVASLNQRLTVPPPQRDGAWTGAVREVFATARDVDLRCAAARALADRGDLDPASHSASCTHPPGEPEPGSTGVANRCSVRFGVGYEVTEGIGGWTSEVRRECKLWLLLPMEGP